MQGGITVGATKALNLAGTGVNSKRRVAQRQRCQHLGGTVTQTAASEITVRRGFAHPEQQCVAAPLPDRRRGGQHDDQRCHGRRPRRAFARQERRRHAESDRNQSLHRADHGQRRRADVERRRRIGDGGAFIVNSGAKLTLDNSAANNNNRLGAATALTMNGGEFVVIGNAGAIRSSPPGSSI